MLPPGQLNELLLTASTVGGFVDWGLIELSSEGVGRRMPADSQQVAAHYFASSVLLYAVLVALEVFGKLLVFVQGN